ncbi:MAG: DUF1549 domain-containing protein [Verrucomicrobiota bacterium]
MKRLSKIPLIAACIVLSGVTSSVADLPERTQTREPLSPAEIEKKAYDIDVMIARGFQEQGIRPVGDATPEQFVRRLYLTVLGRIPTYQETLSYLDDETPGKNAALIDKLFKSPGRVSHDYNYWLDVLRATNDLGASNADGRPYLMFIYNSIATDKPYDQFVRELLTSSGGGWQIGDASGAVGYFERDKGMPLDNMSNTMQIFLGTRMECAQCHNHPFNEDITQKDFFHTAAFTNGLMPAISGDRKRDIMMGANFDNRRERDSMDYKLYRVSQFIEDNILGFGVSGGGDGVIKLPVDYQYRDADPNELIGMESPFGDRVRNRAKPIDNSRAQFATWLTANTNPNFAKVIANRMWKRVMGYGIIEPVDNLDRDFTISNENLLNYITKLMIDLDYDLTEFRRILHNTKTFRQQPNTGEHTEGAPYYFQGRLLSRMTAEQIWDSLVATIVPNIDERLGNARHAHITYRGRPVLVGKKDMYALYEEVVNLEKGQYKKWIQNLYNDMEADLDGDGSARGKKNAAMEESMMMSSSSESGAVNDPRWSGYDRDLLRASELPSPAPATHFLRKFGQSARLTIEGATKESDVTQILSLINGEINKQVIGNSKSVLYQNMDQAETPEDKVDAAFLTILNRRATDKERDLFLSNVEKNGDRGYDNLVWALFNSSEFLFVQ